MVNGIFNFVCFYRVEVEGWKESSQSVIFEVSVQEFLTF
jgi:hypothetical protein